MSAPVQTFRVIVEETTQRVYEITEPGQMLDLLELVEATLHDEDPRPVSLLIGKRAIKGRRPALWPEAPVAELTRITRLRTLSCVDGKPVHEIIRTPNQVVAKSVKS